MYVDPSPWWGISQSGITAIAGLGGIAVGAWFVDRHQAAERRNARIKQQLQEFYSPLLGMRAEIKVKSELRVKLSGIGNSEWQKLFSGTTDPAAKHKIESERWPEFENLIQHSDDQLRTEIIPLYRKMLALLSENMWLAEPSTLKHYPKLLEFVEIWNRHLSGALPSEVARALDPQEKELYPLYEDLQKNFDKLTESLGK